MALTNTRDIMDLAAASGTGQGAFNVIHLETIEGLIGGAEAAGPPRDLADLRELRQVPRRPGAGGRWQPWPQPAAQACPWPCTWTTPRTRRWPTRPWTWALAPSCTTARTLSMSKTLRLRPAWPRTPTRAAYTLRPSWARLAARTVPTRPGVLTDPAEAAAFVAATGVDALAVAVGSSHAMTERSAALNLVRIAELKAALDVPLVLHGSSGVSDEIIVAAIAAGMTKINVSTHLNGFFTRAVREYLDANPAVVDSRKYLGAGRTALVPEVARLLALFAGAGQTDN